MRCSWIFFSCSFLSLPFQHFLLKIEKFKTHKHSHTNPVENGGKYFMVKILFYALKISLRLSHPQVDAVVLRSRRASLLSQMLHVFRLMWKMLLMFNVWQRFSRSHTASTWWISNEHFWLLSFLSFSLRWCSAIWATYLQCLIRLLTFKSLLQL